MIYLLQGGSEEKATSISNVYGSMLITYPIRNPLLIFKNGMKIDSFCSLHDGDFGLQYYPHMNNLSLPE